MKLIALKDKKPIRGQEVLFYFPPTFDSIGRPVLPAMWRVTFYPCVTSRQPTHWARLPEAPEPEK